MLSRHVTKLLQPVRGRILTIGECGLAGATVLDLHSPSFPFNLGNPTLPRQHLEAYDWLIDPGTIEHTSDPWRALNHYNDLLAPHGTMLIETVTDSFQCHGYVQFNPEWFADILQPAGYTVDLSTYAAHALSVRRRYALNGPSQAMRLQLPRLLLIVATKPATASLARPIQRLWGTPEETALAKRCRHPLRPARTAISLLSSLIRSAV